MLSGMVPVTVPPSIHPELSLHSVFDGKINPILRLVMPVEKYSYFLKAHTMKCCEVPGMQGVGRWSLNQFPKLRIPEARYFGVFFCFFFVKNIFEWNFGNINSSISKCKTHYSFPSETLFRGTSVQKQQLSGP